MEVADAGANSPDDSPATGTVPGEASNADPGEQPGADGDTALTTPTSTTPADVGADDDDTGK